MENVQKSLIKIQRLITNNRAAITVPKIHKRPHLKNDLIILILASEPHKREHKKSPISLIGHKPHEQRKRRTTSHHRIAGEGERTVTGRFCTF